MAELTHAASTRIVPSPRLFHYFSEWNSPRHGNFAAAWENERDVVGLGFLRLGYIMAISAVGNFSFGLLKWLHGVSIVYKLDLAKWVEN